MTGSSVLITLTEGNFQQEVLESERPVLVDFWADWCGPCHVIAPAVEALSEAFAGRVGAGRLDIDQYPDIASEYGVGSIPTLLFFRGGQVVDRIIGTIPKKELEDRFNAVLHAPEAAL